MATRMRQPTPSDQELRQEVRHRLEAFCQEQGYHLAPHLEDTLDDFVRAYRRFGDFYCPCQLDHSPDTVCVCTPVRQGLVDVQGSCFCDIVRE